MVAQIVQVPVGDSRQALKLSLAIGMILALENTSCGRAAQTFMGFIDLGQQLDIGPGVAQGKTTATGDWFRICPVAR